MIKYVALLSLVILAACNGNDTEEKYIDNSIKPKPIPAIPYTVVAEYPHDTSAYTQGLEFF
ncbi:MAG: glutaminyl-peptide cyclotransferase [Chitinophagaceae bacterium]|nr:glutaminyl-peptide cyclotransferase [Chitinophagaceae bacterium]